MDTDETTSKGFLQVTKHHQVVLPGDAAGQLEFDGGTEAIIPFILGVNSRHKNHHPFISG